MFHPFSLAPLLDPLPSSEAFPLLPAAFEPVPHPAAPAAAPPGPGLPRLAPAAVTLLRMKYDSVEFKGTQVMMRMSI